jgi:large subunit ribosomal protein L6
MSRIGKQTIEIPEKTEVTVEGSVVRVKGPHGELSKKMRSEVEIIVEGNTVIARPRKSTKLGRALWGTYASLIKGMVRGVNEPFVKKLVVEGVGYRVSLSGKDLQLSVGFSHPVIIAVPETITVSVEKNEITISGADKEQVGQFAANVRAVKKPEPYKGKGIRYDDEVVRRKQGKRAVT